MSLTGAIIQLSTSRGGIPKLAVSEAFLTATGLEGDVCAHPRFHGGPNQAILLITSEALEEMQAAGFPVSAGALGENITTTGLDRRAIRIGQQFRAGEAIVEITKLRVPCATLNVFNADGRMIQKFVYDEQVKAGDPTSPRWGLAGFYAKVPQPGRIRGNDAIHVL